jgi:hypothetical protein
MVDLSCLCERLSTPECGGAHVLGRTPIFTTLASQGLRLGWARRAPSTFVAVMHLLIYI